MTLGIEGLEAQGAHPRAPRNAPSTSAIVDDIADLSALYDPAMAVCVWRRPPVIAIAKYLEQHVLCAPCDVRFVVDATDVDVRPLACLPPGAAGRELLIADLRYLAEAFCVLMGARAAGLRFVGLASPMCPSWHVDRVLARLVCTYAGPGSEWCEPDSLTRATLLARSPAARGQVLASHGVAIRRLGAFDVGLFKGEAWPENEGRGAVHRSPAGASNRALLTIDALE